MVGADESIETGPAQVKKLIALPQDMQQVFSGEHEKGGAMLPWEATRITSWPAEFQVESQSGQAESVSMDELWFAHIFRKYNLHRSDTNELMMDDPIEGLRPFAFNRLLDLEGRLPSRQDEIAGRKQIFLRGNPVVYVQRYLRRFIDRGMLTIDDVRRAAGTESSRTFVVPDQPLNPKGTFLQGARYSIGRQLLRGIGIEQDPTSLVARNLAPDLYGLVDPDTNTILATFPPLSDQEKIDLRRKAPQPYVGANLMKERLRPYGLGTVFPPQPHESPADYQDRLDRLDQVQPYAMGMFRHDLQEAFVGTHNLSWPEQLVIASAIQQGIEIAELKILMHDFGHEALRTFLSVEQGGAEAGQRILEIMREVPKDLADQVFAKYSAMVDVADSTAERAAELYPDQTDDQVARIQESLMFAAKDILDQLHQHRGDTPAEITKLVQQLDNLSVETLQFIKLFNRYRGDFDSLGVAVDSDIAPDTYSPDQVDRLRHIFHSSRQRYSSPQAVAALDQYFEAHFEPKSNERFIDFRKALDPTKPDQETILGMGSYTIDADGSVLVRSVGFAPEASHPAFAYECMQHMVRALRDKFPDRPLKAEVQTENPVLQMYLKRFGFKLTEPYITDFAGTGEDYYTIILPPAIPLAATSSPTGRQTPLSS